MAVPVNERNSAAEVGDPQPLFEINMARGTGGSYEVSRDGRRFLFTLMTGEENRPSLTLLVHWNNGLTR